MIEFDNTENFSFSERCYKKLNLIPKGMVSTYYELAKSLGCKGYRAVGNAMAKNPNPIIVPCHRIVKKDGSLGNYSLGINKKQELLESEGLTIENNKIINFQTKLYKFPLK